jgi:hypothetical protein
MVKARTLMVVWHEKAPVFSVDFHTSGLLATGGGDKDIKVREQLLPRLRCACWACWLRSDQA